MTGAPVRLFEPGALRRALRRSLRALAGVPAADGSCAVLIVSGDHAPVFRPARVVVGSAWLARRLRAEVTALLAPGPL